MPVVPFSKEQSTGPQMPQVDPNFLLMAAGMMHREQQEQQYDDSKRSEAWKQGEWSKSWKQAVPPDNKQAIPKDWESIEEEGLIFSRPKKAKPQDQEDLIS